LYKFKNYGAKIYQKISWQKLDGFWSDKLLKELKTQASRNLI